MTQPPIVPGPTPEPPEPQQPWQQPKPPPAPPGQYGNTPGDVVSKSVIGTIAVVATLVILLCVGPMFLCVACGAIGSVSGS